MYLCVLLYLAHFSIFLQLAIAWLTVAESNCLTTYSNLMALTFRFQLIRPVPPEGASGRCTLPNRGNITTHTVKTLTPNSCRRTFSAISADKRREFRRRVTPEPVECSNLLCG